MEEMKLLTNYHTHCVFCDGNNTPREMVEAAIEAGMTHLGFSSHAGWPFCDESQIHPCDYPAYVSEIRSLQEEFKDKIEILLGFEVDWLPPVSAPDKKRYARFAPDYLIGSVHYVCDESRPVHNWLAVDAGADTLQQGIDTLFGGDGKKVVQKYFDAERQMMANGGFDIVGHIDLVRKNNGKIRFFDENDGWYKKELEATAEAAHRSGIAVEINTGGMARVGLESPYPSAEMLRLLKKYDVPVVIDSDAHSTEHLTWAFDIAEACAREAGYKEIHYLTRHGWKTRQI